MSTSAACAVTELTLEHGVRAVELRSDLVAVTVLPDKGADIYRLVYLPRDVDVLWKSPWGLYPPDRGVPSALSSQTAWLEAYAGGWQLLFPNGGSPCVHRGAELGFHGEASLAPWEQAIVESGGASCRVAFTTRLRRSPFRLSRVLELRTGEPVLHIAERITNEGGEAVEYMWSHHPAFGAPFLSGACTVQTGARRIEADDGYAGSANPLRPGETHPWPPPPGETRADLARVPAQHEPRDLFAYFSDFESGWFAVTNEEMGLGAGLAWPAEVFPYAWFWQEMYASPGYPWYRGCYVMALEPATSIPGQGLTAVMAKTGTHRVLAPGECVEAKLATVFYEGTPQIASIGLDGRISTRM